MSQQSTNKILVDVSWWFLFGSGKISNKLKLSWLLYEGSSRFCHNCWWLKSGKHQLSLTVYLIVCVVFVGHPLAFFLLRGSLYHQTVLAKTNQMLASTNYHLNWPCSETTPWGYTPEKPTYAMNIDGLEDESSCQNDPFFEGYVNFRQGFVGGAVLHMSQIPNFQLKKKIPKSPPSWWVQSQLDQDIELRHLTFHSKAPMNPRRSRRGKCEKQIRPIWVRSEKVGDWRFSGWQTWFYRWISGFNCLKNFHVFYCKIPRNDVTWCKIQVTCLTPHTQTVTDYCI